MYKILLKAVDTTMIECVPSEELPRELTQVSPIKCQYSVKDKNKYFLINFTASTDVLFTCQRCGNPGNTRITLSNTLALCPDDDIADRVLKDYESVVFKGAYVDLENILMDELRLHSYLKHPEGACCPPNDGIN